MYLSVATWHIYKQGFLRSNPKYNALIASWPYEELIFLVYAICLRFYFLAAGL